MPIQLRLDVRLADIIRREALASYPQECCGLLIGAGDSEVTVADVVPTPNVADTPANRFAIDPQRQFDLLRSLRGSDRRIVGHFHSHPGGAAVPSAYDLAMAHDPGAVWVIAAAALGKTAELKAYVRPPDAPDFVEIPLIRQS